MCAPCIKHFLMSVSSFLTLLLKSWVFELKCKIYFAKEFPVCFLKLKEGLAMKVGKGELGKIEIRIGKWPLPLKSSA